jgi:serine/threonine protein kinase
MSFLSAVAVVLAVFAILLGLGLVAGVFFLFWKVLRAVFWLLARALGFVKDELGAAIHTVGALVTACATVPLALVNLVILRLGAARHYARAFGDELKGAGVGLWRVALGNPLRFLGLGALVDGVERRLPDAMERAPRTRRARRATFEGYEVVGTLPSGGSGAQLFVARPKNATQRRFLQAGRVLPGEVVIKAFALEAGSTLPQIVRESRALEAASKLGLVCEHQLTDDQFFYVMPYVKGEDLERVTRALHARGTNAGLADAELGLVLSYAIDLCDSLQRFHSGGLWHKDVKPSNVIVAKGRAHLVDFGLVTPLASALTLTTHGTEYYRDPEMVRLAMQGVKVHEVDGVRFDVYSAGAVLYSMLENCFPAHGSLSRLSKRAPDGLRWIVQRAMADLGSRYPSAAEMRADLAALAAAANPFELRPADLPSFARADAPHASPASSASPARVADPVPLPAFAPRPHAAFEPAAVRAPRRSLGGRLVRGSLVAAGTFGLLLSGLAVLAGAGRLRAHAASESSEPSVRTVRHEPEPRLWTSLSESERKLVDLAEGVASDLGLEQSDGDAGSASVPSSGPAPSDAAAAREASGADASLSIAVPGLPARGRVLVLDDVTTAVDPRVVAFLRTRLAERGFTVAGSDSGEAGATEIAASETVELLAGARHALGLGRAEEPATQASLQRFLDRDTALDALIVVSRAEDEREHLYRVFVRAPAQAGAAPEAGAELARE